MVKICNYRDRSAKQQQSTMADANGNHLREELGKCYCSTVPEAHAKRHGIYSCVKCDNFRLY